MTQGGQEESSLRLAGAPGKLSSSETVSCEDEIVTVAGHLASHGEKLPRKNSQSQAGLAEGERRA